MQMTESLVAVLREPTAAGVWELRGDLMARGLELGHRAFRLLAELHRFLDRLETGAASRDHSERASMMDIGSFGGVVASELAEAEDAAELARRLLAGAITEGLAVLATRQHVKAWRGELAAVYRDTAWFLYDELWRWAAQRKPDLEAAERRQLIEQLLAPARDGSSGVDDRGRTVLLCSLFLLLLVDALAPATVSDT
jgi:hypothetical protein